MENAVNLFTAGSEPLELQLTLSVFLPKETSIEQTRLHGDPALNSFIYSTATAYFISHKVQITLSTKWGPSGS